MRKLAAVVLAIPVIASLYLGTSRRRMPIQRLLAALAAGAAFGLVVVVAVQPPATVATQRSEERPVASAEFTTKVGVDHALGEPVAIAFSAPMDPASVAEALRVEPETAVHLTWDDRATTLTLTPVEHWTPSVLHTVTVSPTARTVEGGPLATPLRAVFLTRDAATAHIDASSRAGSRVRLDTTFVVRFETDVDLAAAASALHIRPAVPGRVELAGAREGDMLTFVPSEPLKPSTRYTLAFGEPVRDADGALLDELPELSVATVPAAGVVRFRPRAGTEAVARKADISVRFTQPMDRRTTAKAFSVTANGRPVKGTVSWAERDTVLVFDPKAALPYGAKVVVRVAEGATSRAGAPLTKAAAGSFRVVPKPAPPAPTRTPTRAPAPIPRSSGGGSVASGSWGAVERYYLRLMNCTRTGGWVTSGGDCSSPGGRNVAALKLDAGISSKVARPYAKLLATRGICNHFIGGNPGDRLRRAGYTSYRWAENLGCRSGNPYSAVLGSHRYFQSEKPYNGGHYVNLMNPAYDRVGIGVWVSSGRVRLVVDFYHP